jgi:hypothetical protein
MPPRYTVDKLPLEQKLFILDLIVNQKTDQYISVEFQKQFGKPLAKSSLNRWRNDAGNELADRATIVRLQADKMLEQLKEDPDADKYEIVMKGIQDRLLTAMSEVNKTEPAKLIIIQQEERRRSLKERELALKERAQHFAEEQARKSEQLQHDRLAIGADTWQFILSFLLGKEPQAADLLTKHSTEILNGLEAHLDQTA